jgi:hypothetical protein
MFVNEESNLMQNSAIVFHFALRAIFTLHNSKNAVYISKYFWVFSITNPEGNKKVAADFFSTI